MGFDFDEQGRNEEFDATDGEVTGEPGDKPRPPRTGSLAAQKPVIGDAERIVAALIGRGTGVGSPTATPATAEEAVQMTSDSYMDEIEKRLEVAHCYREFLANPLFDNSNEASRIAEFEIRAFVRERLGALMGVGEAGAARKSSLSDAEQEVVRLLAEFTPAEITALKTVATKLAAAMEAPPPVLRPVQAPVKAPTAKPTLAVRQGTTAQASTPVSESRRGPGRPPGAKNKPKAAPEKKPAVDGDGNPIMNSRGEQAMITPQRRQYPAGAIPFPASKEEMEAAVQVVSTRQESRLNANPVVGALAAISKNS